MNHASTSPVWAEALFASVLQRSDRPSPGQVRKAVAATVRANGGRGCAGLVAQEFGDHPETAAQRMRWARAVADEVFTPAAARACTGQCPQTAGAARRRPAETAASKDMKRIHAGRARIRRERPWREDLPADPP